MIKKISFIRGRFGFDARIASELWYTDLHEDWPALHERRYHLFKVSVVKQLSDPDRILILSFILLFAKISVAFRRNA